MKRAAYVGDRSRVASVLLFNTPDSVNAKWFVENVLDAMETEFVLREFIEGRFYGRIFVTVRIFVIVTVRWRNNRKIVDKMKAIRDARKNEGFIGVRVHFAPPSIKMARKGADLDLESTMQKNSLMRMSRPLP